MERDSRLARSADSSRWSAVVGPGQAAVAGATPASSISHLDVLEVVLVGLPRDRLPQLRALLLELGHLLAKLRH
jgi:hypothetical protein